MSMSPRVREREESFFEASDKLTNKPVNCTIFSVSASPAVTVTLADMCLRFPHQRLFKEYLDADLAARHAQGLSAGVSQADVDLAWRTCIRRRLAGRTVSSIKPTLSCIVWNYLYAHDKDPSVETFPEEIAQEMKRLLKRRAWRVPCA